MNTNLTSLLLFSLAINIGCCWSAPSPRLRFKPRQNTNTRTETVSLENENTLGDGEIYIEVSYHSNNEHLLATETEFNLEKSIQEMKTSLSLVKFLPSEIKQVKVKEAVVVLGQVLSNPNPVLHQAVENALRHIRVTPENHESLSVAKLLSFLENFKEEISNPGNDFPRKFSDWLRTQIVIVERVVLYNMDGLNKLGNADINSTVHRVESGIKDFESFIEKGAELLLKQTSNQLNGTLLSDLKQSLLTGRFHRVSASIVWDFITSADEDEEFMDGITFMTALQEVSKRSNLDLQPMTQALVRTVESFLKTLTSHQKSLFIIELGQWNPADVASTSADENL